MAREDFAGAALAYRSARRKCEGKDPEAFSRIREKEREADDRVVRELADLVRQHLEDGEPEVAREQLEVARNFAREHPDRYDDLLAELERGIEARVKADHHESEKEYDREIQEALREEEVTEEIIEFEQALGSLGEADAEEAKTYGPHFRAGFLALVQGEIETAVGELELATHERPESALVYEQWGKALDLAGRSAEARRAYGKALQRDPRRREARVAMANTLDQLENKDAEAIHVLTEGIEHTPDAEPQLRISIGAIHLNRGRPDQALAEFMRTLELMPDGIPDLWHLKGMAHEMLGDLDQAESAFEAAYASDSRTPARRIHYVEFCLRHKRSLAKAENTLVSVCQSCGFPSDPRTMATFSYYLALLSAERGKREEALSTVARALSQGVPPDLKERFANLKKDLEAAADHGEAEP